MPDTVETGIQSHGPSQQMGDVNTMALTRGADVNYTPSSTQLHPLQALSFIARHVGELDETSRSRLISGDVTIQDILQTGMDVLGLRRTSASNRTDSPGRENLSSVLRTDRILIPHNRMLIHTHSLPCVYTNHLRIKQFSTLAAIRANAELLGLTFEEIIDPATESPFFSGALTAGNRETAAFTKFEALKPDLRPTESQIKNSHHPYIDLLPCPMFRQRFVHLATMDPPMFDEDEFCQDLENDGLICWGSYVGERNEVTGSGAPWDIRSWEAQPWFLKKWWFLVGGEEGELFQQTRWWHEIRGDQLPYFW